MVRVGEVMRKDVQPVPAEMTVGELAERIGAWAELADALRRTEATTGTSGATT